MSPVKPTIAELFEIQGRWTRGAYARDVDGEQVIPDSPRACRWCLGGALLYVYGEDDARREEARRRIYAVIGIQDFAKWNDTHSHAEVLAAVREAGV